jgi:transcriptional regulator with XRE-family HTH domain
VVGAFDNLRERRLAVGLSQECLAQLAGCSTATVRLAEGGFRGISAQMRARLDEAVERVADELAAAEE